MNIESLLSHRRRIAGAVAVFVLLMTVWYFALHGLVIVQTGSDATVTITESDNATRTWSGAGGFFSGIPTGGIDIVTTTAFGASETHRQIAPFSITVIDMPVQKATEVEYVTNFPNLDLQASKTALHFLATDTNKLMRVDTSGTVREYATSASIYQVAWSSEATGIATANDGTGYLLYSVKNDGLSVIPLPDPAASTTNLSISATRSKYFVIQNNKLYSSPSDRISFTFITAVLPNTAFIASSDSAVAYVQSDGMKANLYVYQIDTKRSFQMKLLLSETPETASSAAFSPDGTKLLVADSGNGAVYDRSLKQLYTLPKNATGQSIWKTNSEIIYVGDKYIWRYNPSTSSADAIGMAPNFVNVLHLFPDTSGKYLYLDGLSGRYMATLRLPLDKGASVSTTGGYLGESNMVELGTSCTIHYVNFSKITIAATGQFADLTSCRSLIDSYISSIGIQPSDITIQRY